MGVQLEHLGQSLEQYGPWHFGDAQFEDGHRAELEAALLQTATISGLGDRLLEISKGSRSGSQSSARLELKLKVKPTPPGSPARTASGASTPCRLRTPGLASNVAGRIRIIDGPGTSSTTYKKRRLLRHLITSRLSQPFSLPATHILNREAVTSGDKRFLKLTAIMSARRLNSAVVASPQAPCPPQQPNPSTWLHRAALLNSLRSRVYATAAERANMPVPDLAAKTAVFQQSHGSTTAFVGGRYLITTPNPNNHPTHAPPHRRPPLPGSPQPHSSFRPSGPGNHHSHGNGPIHIHQHPTHAGLTTGHHHHHHHHHAPKTCLRIPSPTLRPLRSPELRVTRPLIPLEDIEPLYDESSDDGMAFPTSELESRYVYDDEDDDWGWPRGVGGVYADFSVYFLVGGGGW
ncbi:hypothetical protein CHGG_05360 [Chaetomium globosum CBS 148.51]|uniref:Uncharacterized protein n=1 Tax=Chaetomium globosum (strain ATCC 6205 / CBS 148.51 / DSM 1962 / NBRC 6347 / NRRL 1970) TaxID=306901 RepID=Q2H7K5_CHAGB|nr:uncharacterized protein CHGG_05360 [Chaetomium globosum CBS 148.51]EAQ88741.1 hypothetical protein CHGG_05360 [Chaetomium globosum CBS 148.51]